MARLDGTAQKDILHGTPLGDEIYGLGGDDVLYGSGGPDFLNGGTGDDRLFGGAGNDDLYGGDGNDWLSGGAGSDRLDGGRGADRMAGGSGDDAYIVDDPGDQVIEAASFGRFDLAGGIDIVLSYLASYTLPSGVENLDLRGAARDGTGNALANVIHGNELDNVLSGLAGDDALLGGGGNDTLLGGPGNDILIGGPGSDLMQGGSGDDTYYVEDDGDLVSETSTFTFRDLTLRIDAGLDVGLGSEHDAVHLDAVAELAAADETAAPASLEERVVAVATVAEVRSGIEADVEAGPGIRVARLCERRSGDPDTRDGRQVNPRSRECIAHDDGPRLESA
jgi:Ca2+-binding RTX toxin-like protein